MSVMTADPQSAKTIRHRRVTLERRQAAVSAALQLLQIECEHPTPDAKYEGSSGNYDPSSDAYWIKWVCPDCGKRWQTDQTHETRAAYPNARIVK